MFKTSYQTTAGLPFYKKDLVKQLIQAKYEEALVPNLIEGVTDLYVLVDDTVKTHDIPTFDNPIHCEDSKGLPFWVIDLRPYKNKVIDESSGEKKYVINSDGQVGLQVNRALLEMQWFKYGPTGLLHASNIPLVVFTRWISGLIRKRSNLDPDMEQRVQVIISYYYLNLHVKEEDYNERVHQSFLLKIIKTFRIPENVLTSLLKNIKYMGSFNDLVDQLNTVHSSLRITGDFLYTLIASSWYGGANTRAILNISLEFPPTFVALVVAGATENFYRKTIINTFTEKECRKGDISHFVSNIRSLVGELK